MTGISPSEKAMLKLYAEHLWDSPWVFSAFVALTEKGLDFSTELLDLGRGDQKTSAYAGATLTARVPAIDHDGFVLSESAAIVEYLEEAFPPPAFPRLLPEGLRERARARQLMHWLRSDLGALREERPTTTMFYRRAEAPLGAAARAAADKLFAASARLVPSGGGPLFGSWCIADAELAFMLHRLILNRDSVPEPVAAWARREWERPSVQAFVKKERPSIGV